MTTRTCVYEIEFDVLASKREEFEEWLSSDIIDWVNHETIACFEVFQNEKGLSPEVKLSFGFETVRAWATFVGTEEHKAAIERLGTLAEDREAVLWERASVKLDGVSDVGISNERQAGNPDQTHHVESTL